MGQNLIQLFLLHLFIVPYLNRHDIDGYKLLQQSVYLVSTNYLTKTMETFLWRHFCGEFLQKHLPSSSVEFDIKVSNLFPKMRNSISLLNSITRRSSTNIHCKRKTTFSLGVCGLQEGTVIRTSDNQLVPVRLLEIISRLGEKVISWSVAVTVTDLNKS